MEAGLITRGAGASDVAKLAYAAGVTRSDDISYNQLVSAVPDFHDPDNKAVFIEIQENPGVEHAPIDKLYRGEVHTFEKLGDRVGAVLYPGSMEVDDNGRRAVKDGNPYGVYMSTNANMVEAAYGMPHHASGTPVAEIRLNTGRGVETLRAPAIGVIYEVDAKQLLRNGLRKPEMLGPLGGHYNNGFEGDEWVADSAPPTAYKIKGFTVGVDVLANAQRINLADPGDPRQLKAAFATVSQIYAQRVEALGTLADAVQAVPNMVVEGRDGRPETSHFMKYALDRLIIKTRGTDLKSLTRPITIDSDYAAPQIDIGASGTVQEL